MTGEKGTRLIPGWLKEEEKSGEKKAHFLNNSS
jgi:hypothetical protein